MDRFVTYPRRLTRFIDKSVESFAILSIVIIHLQLIAGSLVTPLSGYHHHPHHHHQGFPPQVRWTKPPIHRSHHGRPVDIMTDVINDLGVKILDRYVDNAGNVGFSPSGLGFVLVALYEGSAGSSNRQISEVLGLPNDRRITRIGLRDIHRRLRSYLNADAFLGGLTLNRDDINLRPEYEDILRFYGFDISDSGIDGNVTTILPGGATDAITDSTAPGGPADTTSSAANTLVASTDPSTSQSTMADASPSTAADGNPSTAADASPSTAADSNPSTAADANPSTAADANPSTAADANPSTTADANPSTMAATSPMPTTINDAVEIITDTTGGTNSALSMASTAGSPSTNATPTTLDAMSQIVAATNSTNSLPPMTAPMTTTLSSGAAALTATTPMLSITTQGNADSTDAAITMLPMQRLVGPPTDSADMQTQSSTKIIATTPVDNPTTRFTSMAATSMTSNTDRGDANATDLPETTAPMQRIVGSPMTSAEMDTQSSTRPAATSPVENTATSPPTMASPPMTSTNSQDANNTNAAETNVPSQRFVDLPTDPTEMEIDGSTKFAAITTPAENRSTNSVPMNVSTTLPMSMENSNETTRYANDNASTNSVRKRRDIPHGPSGYFSSSADDGIWLDEFGRLNAQDDYLSQDEDIVADSKRPTEVAFLVNGCDYSRVTAAAYTAVLPFAYFPSLRAALLEFPLDDPRYKILVMLPSESNGTRRLARLLATEGITLRQLRRSLRPNWITAVIPSFMLRGFVTLTPFLQRLGISDVFEPRAADLSPMSPDLGVYARDIQQSIGVNIRNNARGGIGGADGGNQSHQRSRSAALVRNARGIVGLPPFFVADRAISPPARGDSHYSPYPRGGNVLYEKTHPLPFVVDRPFLYFIIDDETSVTLLAGRIDDPLNSRML